MYLPPSPKSMLLWMAYYLKQIPSPRPAPHKPLPSDERLRYTAHASYAEGYEDGRSAGRAAGLEEK